MSDQLVGILIEQCNREIKKAETEKGRVNETVEADIVNVCFENGFRNPEKIEEIKKRYMPRGVREKINIYNQAIDKLELVKALLSSVY